MKNLFSTFLIVLMIITSLKGQEVIFDPATYPAISYPAGMSIVEVHGIKYLQVILNGWNSTIDIPEFILKEADSTVTCSFKYAIGPASLAVPLDNSKIRGAVQLMDTINTVKDPWGSDMVPSFTTLEQSSVTGNFENVKVKISSEMRVINKIQFWGQEKVNWSPTKGDTMWIGKVSVVLPPETAPITFIVDDSNLKTSTGFGLKGSWLKATGAYDKNWDAGKELSKFYDDGTHGDKTVGDHIWSVTLNLVVDAGANNWEWGINDSKGNWALPAGTANQKFTLPDAKAQTLIYTNTVSINNLSISNFKVFPNPVSTIINLGKQDLKLVEIYNMVGIKIFETDPANQILDVSTFNPGVYFIKAKTNSGEIKACKFNKQ
jgi:hypothetical protein